MSKIQLDMFSPLEATLPKESLVNSGDPVKVRIRLKRILEEVQNADEMPWDWRTLRLYQTIVPQMTRWLPQDEAENFRLKFFAEVNRLA